MTKEKKMVKIRVALYGAKLFLFSFQNLIHKSESLSAI